MPAGSDLPPLPELPVSYRPLGPRIMGITMGVCLLAISLAAWVSFGAETRAKFTIFQKGTLVAVGLLIASCLYALLRSRVIIERTGLVVVNGYKRHEYAWAQIVAVRMPRGAPWATVDLSDGTTMSLLAIQASDGDRARDATRQLKRLVASPPPL